MIQVRLIALGLAIIITACNDNSKSSAIEANQNREYFENGFIKSELIKKQDSREDLYFYSEYDSGKIDSLYQFRLLHDTLIAWKQYIYNEDKIEDELSIDFIKLDSGNFIRYNLLNPHYELISLQIKNGDRNKSQDSLILLPTEPILPRHIYLKDPGDSVINGFVIDSGVWAKTDTIGTVGLPIFRFIQFKILVRNYALQQWL